MREWRLDKDTCNYTCYDTEEDIIVTGIPNDGDLIMVSDTISYIYNIVINKNTCPSIPLIDIEDDINIDSELERQYQNDLQMINHNNER